jgi:hypothetical protein
MKNNIIKIIKDLENENSNILFSYPEVVTNFTKSSAEYRYLFNKEMIKKLSNIIK